MSCCPEMGKVFLPVMFTEAKRLSKDGRKKINETLFAFFLISCRFIRCQFFSLSSINPRQILFDAQNKNGREDGQWEGKRQPKNH
jgi:hypothetical protein